MDRCNGAGRFELNDELFADKEVQPRFADTVVLVFHADRHLRRERKRERWGRSRALAWEPIYVGLPGLPT